LYQKIGVSFAFFVSLIIKHPLCDATFTPRRARSVV